MNIYLIRNAESEVNFKKTVGGRSNSKKITKKGITQSKKLGARLKKIKFNVIYCSPAIRTQQTAQFCLKAMGKSPNIIKLEPSLLELSQGDWEGKPKKQIYQRQDVVKALKKDCWNFVPGDTIKGESQAMVAKRMKKWLKQIIKKSPKGNIAAFTHAYTIKYLLADLFNLDKTLAYKIPIDNTSITIIEYKDGKPICAVKNDTSHLGKNKK